MKRQLEGRTVAWLAVLAWLAAAAVWASDPARGATRPVDGAAAVPVSPAPAGVRRIRDVAYGGDPQQRYDVYAPASAHGAPVILLVHGGSWRYGDKGMRNIAGDKAARWSAMGFVVVSTNYRLLPRADLHAQLDDVAHALASVQRRAAEWGGDGRRVILVGHSAGAHLVALLSADPSFATARGALPWLGTMSLDSAVLDVSATMRSWHLSLYDPAFGRDPAQWEALSPIRQLRPAGPPILAVCSSRRLDSCPQAHRFAARARTLGRRAEVLEEDLGHAQIDSQLGVAMDYTRRVESFMAALDPHVAQLLGQRPGGMPVVLSR